MLPQFSFHNKSSSTVLPKKVNTVAIKNRLRYRQITSEIYNGYTTIQNKKVRETCYQVNESFNTLGYFTVKLIEFPLKSILVYQFMLNI